MAEERTARWDPPAPAGLRAAGPVDLPFLVLVLALGAFGLVMLFSASYAVALYRRGDPYAYIRPQLLYAALGLGAMWLASRVDYHLYHKLAWPVLGVSLVLLTAVLNPLLRLDMEELGLALTEDRLDLSGYSAELEEENETLMRDIIEEQAAA